jgi:hypothetical protein
MQIREVAVFRSTKEAVNPEQADLLAYNFSESVRGVNCPFTIQLTARADAKGQTWFDKVQPRDLVIISEFGKNRYAGFVDDVRYSSSMTEQGPQRSVVVVGNGIAYLLQSYKFVLDLKILAAFALPSAESAQKAFMAALSMEQGKGAKVRSILEQTYSAYYTLLQRIKSAMGITTFGMKGVLDKYMDFGNELSEDVVLQYPISVSMFRTGDNGLWDVWEQLLNPPYYELFGRWNWELNKYALVFRKTPFNPGDWSRLPISRISNTLLTGYDVSNDNRNVYTFYLALLPGSQIDRGLAEVLSAGTAVIDQKKFAIYGYRPLIAEFRFFDTSEVDNFVNAKVTMNQISRELYYWYKPNEEFYAGTLTFMTMNDPYPRIGERLAFLGGEFYIEQTSRSWSAMGKMTTRLDISRGYHYNSAGWQMGRMENAGQKIKALEWVQDQINPASPKEPQRKRGMNPL